MEQKQKLLAATSSQAQGACSGRMIDRFSNLPVEVAHRILSYVDLEDLTRIGRVSKRCREFHLSAPSLKAYLSNYNNKQEQINFLNSFDRFLFHRGNNKMQHFSIDVSLSVSLCEEIFRVITWIHIAARCNVEVLDVYLSLGVADRGTLELPSCIFLCGSLKSLSVHFSGTLKFPSFACSTNLQCLKLANVSLDEGFSKWFSYSCKCIKELQLDSVNIENLTIESSSLESFSYVYLSCSDLCCLKVSGEKLVDIHIEWGFFRLASARRSLNVFAPNLKYFKWIGKPLNHHDLGNLMQLEKAEIFMMMHMPNEYDFNTAFEVLCSICRVKALILSEDATKALFRQASMRAPFDNNSYLSMHIGSLNDDLVPAMVSLLRGMPNLTTLDIYSYPSLLFDKPKSRGFNRKYWISQNLAFVDQLQEVTIELSHGLNGLELARYILEHAQNLKKMNLFYLSHQSYVIRKIKESKMDSNATVVLRERSQETGRDNDYRCYMRRLRYKLL